MKQQEDLHVVALSGRLTISRAKELSEQLKSSLDEHQRVLVNPARAENIDASCIQVLYASAKYAQSIGKEFGFTGEVPEQVREVLVTTGLCREAPDEAKELTETLIEFPKT
ncbi:MAG: STAS domain-containing protein [Spirochaetales bacterium]|nr:STAS domain-containing protein [Spirochaetales bacterium]MCF7938004.1 STAS domain-containing protein [Spirochaetales bacterium]